MHISTTLLDVVGSFLEITCLFLQILLLPDRMYLLSGCILLKITDDCEKYG